ncbi:MAG: hypothetical protein AAGG75_19950 [Bacteroidota bacterium]
MSPKLRIILGAFLIVTLLTKEKVCEHFGFGQAKQHHGSSIAVNDKADPDPPVGQEAENSDYFVDDSLYRWDEQLLDWSPVRVAPEYDVQLVAHNEAESPLKEPIKIDWEFLEDINYRLRYFSELDMEIYAPIFPQSIQALDGKEVVIEGFVIPFDQEQELLSLSANPYASCFFCGRASPVSVMSMYLKNKGRRYKVDDFKKFKGTLHLNHDNPDEFYYILRIAEEE